MTSAKERFFRTTSTPLPPSITPTYIIPPYLEAEIAQIKYRLDSLESSPKTPEPVQWDRPTTPFEPPNPKPIPSCSSTDITQLKSVIVALQKAHCLLDKSVTSKLNENLKAFEVIENSLNSFILNSEKKSQQSSPPDQSNLIASLNSRISGIETSNKILNQNIQLLSHRLFHMENQFSELCHHLFDQSTLNQSVENDSYDDDVIPTSQIQPPSPHSESITTPATSTSTALSDLSFNQSKSEKKAVDEVKKELNPVETSTKSRTNSDSLIAFAGQIHDVEVTEHDTKFGSKYLRDVWSKTPLPVPISQADVPSKRRHSDSKKLSDLSDDVILPVEGPVELGPTPRLPSYPLPIVPQSNLMKKKGLFGRLKSSGTRNPLLERRRNRHDCC
ncbi:hypothetical protein RCL1_003187 [Eukaryota sp. TZLM3-RCL]